MIHLPKSAFDCFVNKVLVRRGLMNRQKEVNGTGPEACFMQHVCLRTTLDKTIPITEPFLGKGHWFTTRSQCHTMAAPSRPVQAEGPSLQQWAITMPT